ncbi:septal ring lytic transglycosylase RlpA family protein [Leptolyngbya sp. AN03gr2]|uniref:septal ring lytic transglycosylase RlpA family protein n=1 Tax=unclassified Leptolyngbya TaxID=2650499 RepID=UPI003D31B304
MWVASWFSGIPSVGGKLLETPKFLTHVLCQSRVCQSTLPQTRSALQASSSLQLTIATVQHPSADRSEASQSNWLSAIEGLLLPPTENPLNDFIGSMQSLFNQLPIVAASQDPSSVAIVEIGFDGIPLTQSETRPRLGFWQCPTTPNRSSGFQIWAKGCHIATLDDRASAEIFAQRIAQLLETPNLDASTLKAAIEKKQIVAKLGDRTIFTVSDRLSSQLGRPAELIAIDWVNNLRIALGQTSIPIADAQMEMYQLAKTDNSIDGMASWYGPYFHGRQTANGEIFDQNDLTAAHPTLPLGTFLKVTNRLNGKSLVVRVNDRGPYFDNRVLDLSRRAAAILNSEEKGIVPIEAVVMQSAVMAEVKKPPQRVARLITGY